MVFWLYCSGMNLLLPVVMILLGVRFQRHPPRKINALYGYRTARSMRSQETWRFAHRVCGQLWVVLGGVLLVISLAAAPVALGWGSGAVSTASLALVGVELAVLVGSIFPVERALKKHFDQFGRRKDGI